MQEHQVTVEGRTFPLPQPFHVLATANPIEHEGTYPLPEAQLDRFLLRLSFGYPTDDEEWEVLSRRMSRKTEDQSVQAVTDADGVLELQRAVEEVYVAESVGRYAIQIVQATRSHQDTLVGASPRGSLALLVCSRAVALIEGRDFVVPEDIKRLAVPALAHRIVVRPELWLNDVSPSSIIDAAVSSVPVPDAPQGRP